MISWYHMALRISQIKKGFNDRRQKGNMTDVIPAYLEKTVKGRSLR